MAQSEKHLEEFILDSGLVSKAELESAKQQAEEKHTTFADVLVSSGKISEDDMRRCHAYVLGIPYIDLKNEKLDFDVLSLIPEPIARNHNIVSFRKNSSGLEVAMLDITDLGAIDFIKKKTGLKIMPCLTSSESIKSALLQYQKSLKADFGELI